MYVITSAWFGYSVAGADFNGDGYSDIVVGAYRADVLGANNKRLKDAGAVYIYSGLDGATLLKSDQPNNPLKSFSGTAAGDNLGFAVANAGNVDADVAGTEEVIYGVPKADPDGLKNAGMAVVVRSGVTGNEVFRIKGTVKGDLLGRAVSGAGDVNADSHSDVIVGLPKDDVSDPITSRILKDAGTAAVYSGATHTELFHAQGQGAGDWFGSAVASAGDLDSNGRSDVVVGAYRHDPVSTVTNKKMKDAGAVYAYSYSVINASASRLFKVPGEAKGDGLGYSVASGGDLDNDGDADVVAGAYRYDKINSMTGKWLKDVGAVYGINYKISDGTGQVLFVIPGRSKNDHYGQALASAGDVNIDGYSDIITSTPQADRQDPATFKIVKDMGMMEVMSGVQAMTVP